MLKDDILRTTFTFSGQGILINKLSTTGILVRSYLEDNIIEIEIEQETITGMQVLGPVGMDDLGMNIKDILSSAMPKSKKPRKMSVSEAREVLIESEAQKLIDNDEVTRIAK